MGTWGYNRRATSVQKHCAMDGTLLEELGLDIREERGVIEATLELSSGRAINPMTRKPIDRVTFTVVGSRLLYVGPEEFVGAQPINLAHLPTGVRLEELVLDTLNEHLYQLERRSAELSSIGLSPKVDPHTLQLSATVTRAPFQFVIGASRGGEFRITRALCSDMELTSGGVIRFELSEFRDRRALEDYLTALFADVAEVASRTPLPQLAVEPVTLAEASSSANAEHLSKATREEGSPSQPGPPVSASLAVQRDESTLTVSDFFGAFGDALVPARTALEVLCEMQVSDKKFRFAAARVEGKTFRGLLAGPQGKLWAERFEVDQFPGIRALVAELLHVDIQDIEVL
jgi:hypothetical protein